MNMGSRISECLDTLGWQQVELLKRIPELEPATLSALIKRDSKNSDYAPEIADALGVHIVWLLRGTGPQWLATKSSVNEKPPGYVQPLTPKQVRMVTLMGEMTEKQQDELIRSAEERTDDNREVITELARPARNARPAA